MFLNDIPIRLFVQISWIRNRLNYFKGDSKIVSNILVVSPEEANRMRGDKDTTKTDNKVMVMTGNGCFVCIVTLATCLVLVRNAYESLC